MNKSLTYSTGKLGIVTCNHHNFYQELVLEGFISHTLAGRNAVGRPVGHTSPAGLSGLEGSQRDHRIQHLSEQSVEGWDPHLGRVLSQQSPLGNNHTDQTEQDAQESAFCHHLQGCALGWKSFFFLPASVPAVS